VPDSPLRSPVDVQIGQRIRGLVPNRIATVKAIDVLGADLLEVFYRDETGTSGTRMVTPAEIATFEIVSELDTAPAFDGDPDEFRLASEALRIKYAALYDPMAAINSSDVDPLPHQIRAVYEELLPRIPLRFLLADDPGAGKTIMAGLYLKELILRSDCERAIIVAPGGLVEQWREELSQKFDLKFELFTREMVDEAEGRNVFAEHPYLIVRMDQVSRSEDLMEQLESVSWDVAIVDEAHRMSAHYSNWAGEVTETKRFKLGRLLSQTAHNYLLMTATPHAGKEEDFQLFMSLLDPDRFEGKYRQGVHRTDTKGLMRRMVKEDLLKFDGSPLFPERRAYTVKYELSSGERDLYEQVTEYVRTEMGRAERIAQAGDKKRGNNVGFALTVLQRRLASSPEAILRSLERRQLRLEGRLREMERVQTVYRTPILAGGGDSSGYLSTELDDLPSFQLDELDDLDEDLTDAERSKFEEHVDEVVDLATAAQTIPELRAEIAILEDLIRTARRVRHQGEDKKWVQLRTILDEQLLRNNATGEARKIIVFTEHKDTLNYLQQKISAQFGRADSVITIHGGTKREDRKKAREQFTHDPDAAVLLATDAAGEGLNLQRAHLMVNYDLPWNPNRLEQRFGRIHRIGQREVCHLWNMVALDTREGDVFDRLLTKIAQMEQAYNGSLFNVLGESGAFQERSLRDLLLEAIRYGDQPEIKQRLDQIIDSSVSDGLEELVAERTLHPEMFSALNIEEIRERMERARARRLQPGYIAAFFIPAFERLGGQIRKRERGRYEITRVPSRVMDAARQINRWAPVAEQYERVTFDLKLVHAPNQIPASLIAPGHPLLHAVIELIIADMGAALSRGSVLVDRRAEQSDEIALMYTVEQKIHRSDSQHVVSHHFDYAVLRPSGQVEVGSAPPYLDYFPPNEDEAQSLRKFLESAWVTQDHESVIRGSAFRDGLQPRLAEVKARIGAEAARVRAQVEDRLFAEINHWDGEHNRLAELERSGTVGRIRAEAALARARALDARLDRRLAELDALTDLVADSPVVRGLALVVPSQLLFDDVAGLEPQPAVGRDVVERRAVDAVLRAERGIGRFPEEMPHLNPGYDVRSKAPDGREFFIEVKGRIEGSDTFTITSNEVSFAQTQGERHRLALVIVSPNGPEHDQICYVHNAFAHMEPSLTTRSFNEELRSYWDRGGPPS